MRPIPAASYDVELWLVHTTTEGPQDTWHLSGHLDPLGQVIEFPPVAVAVDTTPGIATVSVAAMLRPMITADGLTVLRATIARVLSGGAGFGLTDKVIPMPGPARRGVLRDAITRVFIRSDRPVLAPRPCDARPHA